MSESTLDQTEEVVNMKTDKINPLKALWIKLFGGIEYVKEKEIVKKELLTPWAIKLILVSFLSVITPTIIGLLSGSETIDSITYILQIIAVPMIVMYFFKGVIDDYEGRLKSDEKEIIDLKVTVCNLKTEKEYDKREANLEMIRLKNKHEINITQLQGAIDLKNKDIETLRAYPEILLKQETKGD